MCVTAMASCCRTAEELPAGVYEILKNIKEPTFRQVDYLVTDFGAVADSLTDCRQAINDAITKCSDEGGEQQCAPADGDLRTG